MLRPSDMHHLKWYVRLFNLQSITVQFLQTEIFAILIFFPILLQVSKATGGMVSRPWPAQLNTHVWSKRKQIHDVNVHPHRSLILSIGQVVPHEVMGMANFNKNLFVGVGGVEAINLSHFIGAVHGSFFYMFMELLLIRVIYISFFILFSLCRKGMEKMMGRADNPLRSILNYASENFLQSELDLYYILTVMGTNAKNGELEMKGLYIGNDIQCYNLACDLSLKVNFNMLNRSPRKIVVYLDPDEFHTTWLGNKAIYRTRMAIADGGELIILAPGVKQFGEDDEIDVLIRAHGYRGTPTVLEAMKKSPALKENLSAVAHLIHGSSEGRFKVTYCPGHLSQEEVENVGFEYNDLNIMKKKYDINTLKDGWNDEAGADGEEFYYISNPALGLWAVQSRFGSSPDEAGKESSLTCAVETGVVHQVASNNSGGVGGWKKPPSN